MFKSKISFSESGNWSLARVYKRKGITYYILQNDTTYETVRATFKDLPKYTIQGRGTNFRLCEGGNYRLVNFGNYDVSSLHKKIVTLENRFTPISVKYKGSNIAEVILYDEETNQKVRVSLAQVRILYNAGMTNVIYSKRGGIQFPREVTRYAEDGTVMVHKKSETNSTSEVEELKSNEGSDISKTKALNRDRKISDLYNEGLRKAEADGVFEDVEQPESEKSRGVKVVSKNLISRVLDSLDSQMDED